MTRPERARISVVVFRHRFLLVYIAYGALSIGVELLGQRFFTLIGIPFPLAGVAALPIGVLFAFEMNAHFNFRLAKSKRTRALVYFGVISILSWLVQLPLRAQISALGFSYEAARFAIAGVVFFVAYYFHRRYSFQDYKKVGVAVYADGVERIDHIREKIGNTADFIHVDIVDDSFRPGSPQTKAHRAEVVRAYWPKKPIDVHIMSKKPSQWLPDVLPFADVVFVHLGVDEDLSTVFNAIGSAGCRPGLAISLDDSLDLAEPWLPTVQEILLLSIRHAGYSGQAFEPQVLSTIEHFSRHPLRSQLQICVDGGIDGRTVRQLPVDRVVSGSWVLRGSDPETNIRHLQTGGYFAE